jgi:acyl-CoA synthetase (AMP-forming)/AMP-acid ligase II
MEFNHADLFEGLADAIGDRMAMVCGDRRLTYAELDAHANRLAHHLESAGVTRGQHVGIQLYNGVEYVATMLAALKIRAVPVNVNYRYVEAELLYLYRDSDIVALVYDVEFDERVAAVAPRGQARGPAGGQARRRARRPGPSRTRRRWRTTPAAAAFPRGRRTTSTSSIPAGRPACPKG